MCIGSYICYGNWDVWYTGRRMGSGYSREAEMTCPVREQRQEECAEKPLPVCAHRCVCWEHCSADAVM